MERLVHESRAGIGLHQHLDAGLDFPVVLAGEGLHHDTHGPHHVVSDVRAAYTLAGLPLEEVGVVFAPHESAGVLVDGVVHVDIAEVGHGQQAGYIGIVHEQLVAEAVDLEGVDLAIFRVVVHGILLQSGLHLLGQCGALLSQGFVVIDRAQNFGSLS